MSQYKSIPRTFRPQTFKEVREQATIVQVLKNAIEMDRCSHAYLFCGSRGSGKTTLARLFAKALNCTDRQKDFEPCNKCSSCLEITSSTSLDVLEIDGASNRGIDDIRQLSENTIYAPSSAKYKIYIIDEVHMLTKEAFNALLKTLEEPPENVKFFFATTEPHKVLPTIVSRCQRFDLKRISIESMVEKLKHITQSLSLVIDEEALFALCDNADGSLRDAESLLDQALCLNQKHITYEHISNLLGLSSKEMFFQLDAAILNYDLSYAFTLTQKLYVEGKDFSLFLQKLIEHFQQLLKVKLGIDDFDHLPSDDLTKLKNSAKHLTKEKCLDACDYLLEQLELFRQTPLKKSHIELILLHLIRSSKALSLAEISAKLLNLKQSTPEEKPVEKPVEKKVDIPKVQEVPKKDYIEKPPETTTPPQNEPAVEEAVQEKTLQEPSQKYETLLRFAGVEFNGVIKKPS